VPFGDLVKIAEIIEQFVDQLHHGKEEKGYFPETESRDQYSDEIRKFIIEHEFGRRISRRIRTYLEEYLRGSDAKEPLARYLKTYSIFILDHTSKEDRFFNNVKDSHALSASEEKAVQKQFERIRHDCGVRAGSMMSALEELEKSEWFARRNI
jgi:hemerythrin-like domain-containing protein